MSATVRVEGVVLRRDAAEVAAAVGVSPASDVARLRAQEITGDALLAECLDGVEGDDVILGWHHYVDDVCLAADVDAPHCTVHDADDPVPGRICGGPLPCPEHP